MGKVPVLAAIAVAAVVLSAGCTAGERREVGAGPTPDAPVDDADVAFAQQLIVHHEQVVLMAGMAATRAHDPRVTALAAELAAEHRTRIGTATELLRSWDGTVPAGQVATMPPMPDPAPMRDLRGPQFDRAYVPMAIAHHEGSVALARAALAASRHPAVRRLAEEVRASHTAEIRRMRDLLATPAPTRS